MIDYSSLFTGVPGHNTSKPGAVKRAAYRSLLVDDEPNVLKALRRVFRQENYEIVIANNGQEAVKLLEEKPFQTVISDYLMPGMNGADLLRHAKKIYPHMLRIMPTGHTDTGAVLGAIKEGAVYKFILKPWNDDDLRVTSGTGARAIRTHPQERDAEKGEYRQVRDIETAEVAFHAALTGHDDRHGCQHSRYRQGSEDAQITAAELCVDPASGTGLSLGQGIGQGGKL